VRGNGLDACTVVESARGGRRGVREPG